MDNQYPIVITSTSKRDSLAFNLFFSVILGILTSIIILTFIWAIIYERSLGVIVLFIPLWIFGSGLIQITRDIFNYKKVSFDPNIIKAEYIFRKKKNFEEEIKNCFSCKLFKIHNLTRGGRKEFLILKFKSGNTLVLFKCFGFYEKFEALILLIEKNGIKIEHTNKLNKEEQYLLNGNALLLVW
jgi:hypothetical protein